MASYSVDESSKLMFKNLPQGEFYINTISIGFDELNNILKLHPDKNKDLYEKLVKSNRIKKEEFIKRMGLK